MAEKCHLFIVYSYKPGRLARKSSIRRAILETQCTMSLKGPENQLDWSIQKNQPRCRKALGFYETPWITRARVWFIVKEPTGFAAVPGFSAMDSNLTAPANDRGIYYVSDDAFDCP